MTAEVPFDALEHAALDDKIKAGKPCLVLCPALHSAGGLLKAKAVVLAAQEKGLATKTLGAGAAEVSEALAGLMWSPATETRQSLRRERNSTDFSGVSVCEKDMADH